MKTEPHVVTWQGEAGVLAPRHHPDRGGDEAKFKDVSKAYEAGRSSSPPTNTLEDVLEVKQMMT